MQIITSEEWSLLLYLSLVLTITIYVCRSIFNQHERGEPLVADCRIPMSRKPRDMGHPRNHAANKKGNECGTWDTDGWPTSEPTHQIWVPHVSWFSRRGSVRRREIIKAKSNRRHSIEGLLALF